MKLGVHFSNFSVPGQPQAIPSVLASTARSADDDGVAALTLMGHWCQMEAVGGPTKPMLEGSTRLGFLAGPTGRMSLSPEVVKHALDVLARHCETGKRGTEEIEKIIIGGRDPLEDVDAFLAKLGEYAAPRVARIALSPPTDPLGWAEQLVERVLPRLAEA